MPDDETKTVIVPAAPNHIAVVLRHHYDEEADPSTDEVAVIRRFVLAWCITDFGNQQVATPILNGLTCSCETVLLEMPDGRLEDEDGGTFDTLEDAKAFVLRTAKWRREREQRKTEET